MVKLREVGLGQKAGSGAAPDNDRGVTNC